MAAVYHGYPTSCFNFSTNVPNNANRDPYQHHHHDDEYATRFWESGSSQDDYQPPREDTRVAKIRSHGRHHGDSRRSSCRFCHRSPCQCDLMERLREPDRTCTCKFCGRWSCHCSDDEQRAHSGRRRDDHTDQQALKRQIELLEYYKKEKKYDQAHEVFDEATDGGRNRANSKEMLKLKASFAGMLATQGKYKDAKDMISEILRCDSVSRSIKQQCQEIEGSALCSKKRYTEAEKFYRQLYDRSSKDEWSLKMGEQMCQAIALQGDYDLAHMEQVKLWENRKKSLGKDHPSTVKSAITAVDHLAKLIQKLPPADGSNTGRATNRKLAYEAEVEYIFHDIWSSTAKITRQEVGMMKAGHELGMSLLNRGRFNEAEKILEEIWQDRQSKLGKFDKDAVSSGLAVSQAMYMQGHKRCRDAIKILENIRDAGAIQIQRMESPIADAIDAHLAVAYSRIGERRKAETLARQSLYKPPARGVATPSHYILRLALARALMGQGGQKALEGREIEAKLHFDGQPHSPIDQKLLANGKMLTDGSLTTTMSYPDQSRTGERPLIDYDGPSVGPIINSFAPRSMGGGRSALDLQNLKRRKMRLAQLWNRRPKGASDNLARAEDGHQYAQCLAELGDIAEARRVVNEAMRIQQALRPGRQGDDFYRTATLINSLGQAGRGGNLAEGAPLSGLSNSLVRTGPRNVPIDDRYSTKTPTRRRRLGILEVLMS